MRVHHVTFLKTYSSFSPFQLQKGFKGHLGFHLLSPFLPSENALSLSLSHALTPRENLGFRSSAPGLPRLHRPLWASIAKQKEPRICRLALSTLWSCSNQGNIPMATSMHHHLTPLPWKFPICKADIWQGHWITLTCLATTNLFQPLERGLAFFSLSFKTHSGASWLKKGAAAKSGSQGTAV